MSVAMRSRIIVKLNVGMSFAHYIKIISHGRDGNSELSAQEADALFAAMLDGGVPDLELGAILLAYRLRPESLPELLGFHDALSHRIFRLHAPASRARPVVLPSYCGALHQANLLPLLALLLQRLGMPVLIHGLLESNGRIASAYILRELGIMPCLNLAQAQDTLDNAGIAFVPTAVLSPGLVNLLSTRGRLGVRTTPHMMAKLLDPFFDDAGVRVIDAPPQQLHLLHDFLAATDARALLLQGTEGEPFADPRCRPQIEYAHDGTMELLFEAEVGLKHVAHLPTTVDAIATAKWIRLALAGEVPLPMPIVHQLACCLYASGYTHDLNEAKAIVAVETGTLAAA